MLTLRPYQAEAIEALNRHLSTKESNPCVVIPTAGGKSYIMAEAIRRWKEGYAPFKVIILAHRKELVSQNAEELRGIYPEADIGIYSAGLGLHELGHAITYASIDSVYDKSECYGSFDLIVVDEAHRIPVRGEGKYRRFIGGCKLANPRLRVVGFTATPFRMGSGPICHKDFVLNEICYEANVGDLIRQGYLCKLRSKVLEDAPNLEGVKKQNGDYQQKSLGEAIRAAGLVHRAVTDALVHLDRENRRSVVWFCVDVGHCREVLAELLANGRLCAAVTGDTPDEERDRAVDSFRSGSVNHLLNVNVFTEGFNVKRVDAVVLLRPTLSRSLYVQMVGRGMRLHSDKQDCLVLDYAHCIEQHGPIDAPYEGEVAVEVCGNCREVFARSLRACPKCGWEIPKHVIEEREEAERVRRMHEARAAQLSILGSVPTEMKVDGVMVARHEKNGTSSLRVSYRCGISMYNEWICLDHTGYPRDRAVRWWRERFGGVSAPNVDEALGDVFLSARIKDVTESITVKRNGKYNEIISHKLKRSNEHGI